MPQSPRRSALVPLGLGLFGLAAAAHGQSLDARIDALLGNPQLKNAQVGISIVEITPKGAVPLYSHNAALPLPPASCTKLLTTSAAFEKYGPKGAFNTQFYRVGEDLLIVGSGDPAFCDAKLFARADWPVTHVFDAWAEQLRKLNIHAYRDLLVDDRVFDQECIHPDWPDNQYLAYYEAPIGGLNFNANCLDWVAKRNGSAVSLTLIPDTSYVSVVNKARGGSSTAISMVRPRNSNKFELRGTLAASLSTPESVTIADPGLWTGTILRDRLTEAGIQSTGSVRRLAAEENATAGKTPQLVARFQTPVIDVIRRANTNSLNMMAEGLCKRLGYDATGKPGSWANGTAAVEAFAQSIGVPASLVQLHDGSGLSAENRVAAQAFTTMLAHVAARPDGQLFVETLAIPGEDGTLERRFRGKSMQAVAQGIRAKTGHISGVSCLTGYLTVGDRSFAFSILCHRYVGNVNPWQEEVCKAIYDWAKTR